MTSPTTRSRTAGTKLDTSYVSFESEKGIRSPRTPTYIPDSPSIQSAPPFDHAKFFSKLPSEADNRRSIPPPPTEKPMAWIWICHLCHSRYPLGATRRCLVDGHFYCSGETDKPSLKKKKKNKACSSEFDYAAWKQWGEWRRKVLRAIRNETVFQGCDCCDFPSQCRYPVDIHPLGAGATTSVTAKSTAVDELVKETKKKETEEKRRKRSTANENVDFDQILKNIISEGGADLDMDISDKSSGTKLKKTKEKRTGKISAFDEQREQEAARKLRGLVGMSLSNFEDIELGKAKLE